MRDLARQKVTGLTGGGSRRCQPTAGTVPINDDGLLLSFRLTLYSVDTAVSTPSPWLLIYVGREACVCVRACVRVCVCVCAIVAVSTPKISCTHSHQRSLCVATCVRGRENEKENDCVCETACVNTHTTHTEHLYGKTGSVYVRRNYVCVCVCVCVFSHSMCV